MDNTTKTHKKTIRSLTEKARIYELKSLLSDYEVTYRQAKDAEAAVKKIAKHASNKIKSIKEELNMLQMKDSDVFEEDDEKGESLLRVLEDEMNMEVRYMYKNSELYFSAASLAHAFASKYSDPTNTVAKYIRTYGVFNGCFKPGVMKDKKKWYVTIEAFEKYVLPYLKNATEIDY